MPSFFGLEIPPNNKPIKFRPDVATTVVVCQAALGQPVLSSLSSSTPSAAASIFVQTSSVTGDDENDEKKTKKKLLCIGTLRDMSCEQFSFGTGLTFASGETVTVTQNGKGRAVYLSGRIEEDDEFDDDEDDSDDDDFSDDEEDDDESSDDDCLLYTSPSPRDLSTSRMPSSA